LPHFEAALALHADNIDAWESYGRALATLGQFELAVEKFRTAAKKRFGSEVDQLWREGELLLSAGMATRAHQCFESALTLQPDCFPAGMGRVATLRALSRPGAAVAAMREVVERSSVAQVAPFYYVFLDLLNEFPPDDFIAYQADRKAWAGRFAPVALARKNHGNEASPDRRLRIGYVSSTFRRNSSNEIVWPAISGHDRSAFEVSIFANLEVEDEVTERYRAIADRWYDLKGKTGREGADLVESAEIDILIDIAGLSSGNRLDVFALKPAPIQVTAWGFPVGTGMMQIDWLIADRLFIRPEERAMMAEDIWYLSNWAGYAPPECALEPGPMPAERNGYVTFGSFCRAEKMTARTLDVWCRILRQLPTARMFVKAMSIKSESHVEVVRRNFSSRGIDPSRVDIVGPSSKEEHLACHNRVDIVLDAFPQVGGISTFEALWMGIPVITLYGHVPSSRGAASILQAVDLPETIAGDTEHYVDIALALAGDLDRLAALRRECRPRLLASPAGNPKLYVAEVEQAYRAMWRAWCAKTRA